MDRLLRLRSPVNYSQEYKKKGISIEKRLLRAHNRTTDQKSNRDKNVMCRRDLGSSIQEGKPRPTSELKAKGPLPASEIRKDKLKKWKQEKLLKEKLKKQGSLAFKVCKVTYDNPVFLTKGKALSKLKPVEKPISKPVTRASRTKKVQVERKETTSKTKIGCRQSNRIAAQKATGIPIPTMRASNFSFAPNDFLFNAPGNVTAMAFTPLSPASVQSFFCPETNFDATELQGRRCSTPYTSVRTDANVPNLSAIMTKGKKRTTRSSVCLPAPVMKLTEMIPVEENNASSEGMQTSVNDSSDTPLLTPAIEDDKMPSSRMDSSNTPLHTPPMDDDNMTTSEPEDTAMKTTQSGCSNTAREINELKIDNDKPELSVAHFRDLLKLHSERFAQVCSKWETELEDQTLQENAMGDIRTAIGKAQLLTAQRFKQFYGLIDNCEFGLGEKETTCTDLQGFWEMIYFQVEDVDKMFDELQQLKANGWMQEAKPNKPKIKRNITKKKKVPTATLR